MVKIFHRIRKYTDIIDVDYMDKRYDELIFKGHPGLDFFLLTIISASIATLGFAMNSASIVIGAMVLSPLLYPNVFTGSAITKQSWMDAAKLFQTQFLGVATAVGVAYAISLIAPFDYNSDTLGGLSGSPLQYFFVALLSGFAGTFTYYWPSISETIAGVGIAVAMLPPLVIVGISLASSDTYLLERSLSIVALNVFGILLASILCSHFLWWYARRNK